MPKPCHAEAAELLRVVAGHRLECGIDLVDSGPRRMAPDDNPNRGVLKNSPEALLSPANAHWISERSYTMRGSLVVE